MKNHSELVDNSLEPKDFLIETLKNYKKPRGKKAIRHAHIIPLIGGFPLGAVKELKSKPEFLISYPAFEWNDSSAVSYLGVPYFQIDDNDNRTIIRENMKDLKNPTTFKECKCSKHQIDIVTGTPPCAGLSMLNAQAGDASVRGSDAEVNKWIYMSADYVLNEIKPSVYIIENAPNAFTKMGRGLADKLSEQVQKVGYKLQLFKTSTLLHGIPQARERTFYFITKGHLPKLHQVMQTRPDFSKYIRSIPEYAISAEQIADKIKSSDIPNRPIFAWAKELGFSLSDFLESDSVTYIQFILTNNLLDKMIEIGQKVATHEETQLPASKRTPEASALRMLEHIKKKKDMGKGWWDGSPLNFIKRGYTSAIIAKQFGRILHPDLDRFLVMDEDKTLMGLPLDFEVVTGTHNHIAQNVPTAPAAAIVSLGKEFVEGKLEKTAWDFARFRNDTGKYIETISPQSPLF